MKTTKKQFDEFKGCMDFWLNYFGLKYYRVVYRHEIIDCYAQVQYDSLGKIVTATFSSDIPDNLHKDLDIDQTAYHEVLEILLGRLSDLANQYIRSNKDDVGNEVHTIIRTLENTHYIEVVAKRNDCNK